eukprot:g8464.t1
MAEEKKKGQKRRRKDLSRCRTALSRQPPSSARLCDLLDPGCMRSCSRRFSPHASWAGQTGLEGWWCCVCTAAPRCTSPSPSGSSTRCTSCPSCAGLTITLHIIGMIYYHCCCCYHDHAVRHLHRLLPLQVVQAAHTALVSSLSFLLLLFIIVMYVPWTVCFLYKLYKLPTLRWSHQSCSYH